MPMVLPRLSMFINRSFLPLVAVAVSAAAHAGPINIIATSESTYSLAYTNGGGYDIHSQYEENVIPASRTSSASVLSGSESADTYGSNYLSYENFGATDRLIGNAANYGSTAASPGLAVHTGSVGNYIYFSLSSASVVQFYLSATSYGYTTGDSLYNGGASASLTSYVDGSWRNVSTGTDLSGTEILAAGEYMLSASASNSSRTDGTGLSRVSSSGYYFLEATAVPEPGTMAILGLGAVAFLRRKKRG